MDVKTEQLLIDVLKEINKPRHSIMRDYIRPIIIALTPVIVIGIYGMATYNRTIENTIRDLVNRHENDVSKIEYEQKNISNKTNYNFNVIKDELEEEGIKVNVIDVNQVR